MKKGLNIGISPYLAGILLFFKKLLLRMGLNVHREFGEEMKQKGKEFHFSVNLGEFPGFFLEKNLTAKSIN